MGGIRVCLALAFGACSYSPDPAAVSGDAPVDTEPDGPAVNSNCFGRLGTICLNGLPTGAYSIGATTNTTTTDILASCHPLTSDSNITGCVLAGTSLTIDGKLIGIGSRPLILIATEGPIIVEQTIDVASHRDQIGVFGAGADPVGQCEGEVIATGLGGGAGGSLVGNGGPGGQGATGTGATANTPVIPGTLRGGCRGTLGGNPTTSTGGGGGGGAIWLISKQGITISGSINASGAAGEGGANDAVTAHGGGGGGSGGMIVLDAPTIDITDTGVLLAVGGGGGGSNTVGVAAGGSGGEASVASPDTAPPGGAGGFGTGGAGGTTGDGSPGFGNATGAASGGGGGAGHILTFGPVQSQGFVFPAIVTSQ